jgi:hypothetical protein
VRNQVDQRGEQINVAPRIRSSDGEDSGSRYESRDENIEQSSGRHDERVYSYQCYT